MAGAKWAWSMHYLNLLMQLKPFFLHLLACLRGDPERGMNLFNIRTWYSKSNWMNVKRTNEMKMKKKKRMYFRACKHPNMFLWSRVGRRYTHSFVHTNVSKWILVSRRLVGIFWALCSLFDLKWKVPEGEARENGLGSTIIKMIID